MLRLNSKDEDPRCVCYFLKKKCHSQTEGPALLCCKLLDMQANAPVCGLGLPHRSVTIFEAEGE